MFWIVCLDAMLVSQGFHATVSYMSFREKSERKAQQLHFAIAKKKSSASMQ